MSLFVDSRRQEERSTEGIGAYLKPTSGNSDLWGPYTLIKQGYCHASVRAPNPLLSDMEKVTGDYAVLYRQEDPTTPGIPVPTHFTPFRFNYDVSLEAEVEEAVWRLYLNKAAGHTHLRTENFKKWLQGATCLRVHQPPQLTSI